MNIRPHKKIGIPAIFRLITVNEWNLPWFLSLCWQARRGSLQHWASEASPMLQRDCERSEHVASYEIETFQLFSQNFQNLATQLYKSTTKTAFYCFWGVSKYPLKLEFCLENCHGSYFSECDFLQEILESCDFSFVHSEWVKFTVIHIYKHTRRSCWGALLWLSNCIYGQFTL